MTLHTNNIRLSPKSRDYQTRTHDNDVQRKESRWKICLGERIQKFPCVCRVSHFNVIEGNMRDAIFRIRETKGDDRIMLATSLFGDIINTHQFEDGKERTVA